MNVIQNRRRNLRHAIIGVSDSVVVRTRDLLVDIRRPSCISIARLAESVGGGNGYFLADERGGCDGCEGSAERMPGHGELVAGVRCKLGFDT